MTVIDQLEMKLCTYSVQQLRAYLVHISCVSFWMYRTYRSEIHHWSWIGVEATTTKMLNKYIHKNMLKIVFCNDRFKSFTKSQPQYRNLF